MTRIAVLDRNLCTHTKCGYTCKKVCPINRMSKECVVIEETTEYPVINEQLCIGCGICVKKCPANCICIINLKAEIGAPIFQYGVNAFRIHGMALPKEGVVGLVGKNGIGKTTSLRILTNQLKLNFGNCEKTFSEEEIIERISLEQKRYLEMLGKTIRVSYKPQNIEQIKEMFHGTAEDLLRKFNEQNTEGKNNTDSIEDINRIIEKFGLEKILKRKLSQLSGGEMQKLAIAVSYMKNADIYFFDEPTTYLDISERMNIAIILKELGEKKKIMLAEHDLAMLDYASDYVYLFWGDENVYGVISNIKNVRGGINEYLSGFLKDENIKFRDKEIIFSKFSEEERKRPVKFVYSAMKKHYPNFDLSCDSGDIRKGEIIGIVGRNALGKSTFVKMLAGIEKPDQGKGEKFKVSYKPQYVHAKEGISVEQLFASNELNHSIIEECKRKLDIDRLMLKQLSELSGGELQRTAITLALGMEADLYLLDEPSAFLDIEQRLNLSQLLRTIFSDSDKSAFVVDHDVIFIDALSSRIVVFEGEQSVNGRALAPTNKRDGMNMFLKAVNVTMRRDKDSNRPRINKPESVLDREQKRNNEFYYSFPTSK